MMTIRLSRILGLASACVAFTFGTAAVAQTTDLPPPTGSFTFSGLGATNAIDLPLEMSDESPFLPALEVTDLGQSATVPLDEVQTSRSLQRITQNTWAIGVFR